MKFAGQLSIANDPEPLAVTLELGDHLARITANGNDLGTWSLERVSVLQTGPGGFGLSIDGEEAVFIADDPARFTSDGLHAIEASHPEGPGVISRLWSYITEPADQPYQPLAGPRTLTLVPPEPPEADLVIDIAPDAKPSTEVSALRCAATRADGERCRSLIVSESGFCFSHDPARRDDRMSSARSLRSPADTFDALEEIVTQTIEELRRGDIAPEAAVAIARLVHALATATEAETTHFDLNEPQEPPLPGGKVLLDRRPY